MKSHNDPWVKVGHFDGVSREVGGDGCGVRDGISLL